LKNAADSSWYLKIETGNIRVRKDDKVRRAFNRMSETLVWAKADNELIEYFRQLEADEASLRELETDDL
jgi:hypothetical protein